MTANVVAGPASAVTATGVPPQVRVKASEVAVTGSLKVTESPAEVPTPVAPSAGVVDTTVGASSAVVKPTVAVPAIASGGSPPSTSETALPVTVSRHPADAGRAAAGLTVIVDVPLSSTVKPTGDAAHTRSSAAAGTATGSLNVSTTSAPTATSVAPSAGVDETSVGAASVVNVTTGLVAMTSGGSMASTSLTEPPRTVTLHEVPSWSGVIGVRVSTAPGAPERANATGVTPHVNAKAPAGAVTASENVSWTTAVVATLVEPVAGSDEDSVGAASFGVACSGVSPARHSDGSVTKRRTPLPAAAQK